MADRIQVTVETPDVMMMLNCDDEADAARRVQPFIHMAWAVVRSMSEKTAEELQATFNVATDNEEVRTRLLREIMLSSADVVPVLSNDQPTFLQQWLMEKGRAN